MTKILIDRSTVEQALEALRHVVRQAQENLVPTIHYGPVHDITNRLEAALAEPVQEPVAWKDKIYETLYHQNFGNSIPLYAAPPQRKPLTEEEIYSLFRAVASPVMFARAIEREHGIT